MKDYDVLVCGGGSAGCAAAIEAAKAGLRVCLAEQQGQLGGILTGGNVWYVMDAPDTDGILGKLRSRAKVFTNDVDYMMDGEWVKLFLENEVLSSGAELRYFSTVTAAEAADGRIASVTLQDQEGAHRVTARAYVDCTGDGVLAYFAGAGYDYDTGEAPVQPMSFEVVVSGIDKEAVAPFLGNYGGYNPEGWQNFLAELRRAGIEPSYPRPLLHDTGDGLFIMNVNHQYLSGLKQADVTRATVEGRRESYAAVEALRALGGVWKDLHVVSTPSRIGSREGRRIHGKYTVTAEDLVQGRRCENAACHVSFGVDIHSKKGYETGGVKAKPYDVPMEALMSRDLENLYMAGRDISGDVFAHASYRVTGNTFVMGESLGRWLAEKLREET